MKCLQDEHHCPGRDQLNHEAEEAFLLEELEASFVKFHRLYDGLYKEVVPETLQLVLIQYYQQC